jgi:hypothetical protein
MSDKVKKFITEHRQEFDTGEPGKDLWKKIDAQLDAKKSSTISSKWLSSFKYLGFGASIVVVALYFILRDHPDSSAGTPAMNGKDPVMPQLTATSGRDQNRSGLTRNEDNNMKKVPGSLPGKKTAQQPVPASGNNPEQNKSLLQDSLLKAEHYPVLTSKPTENKKPDQKKITTSELYIPAEPSEMNSYTGTLYDGASLCSVLLAYKFPGKVSGNKGKWDPRDNKNNMTIRTRNCNLLGDDPDIKVIWLKGKTDKEITIPVKKDFKNILLLKKDGRRLNPEAISHYYPGFGVISEYKGTGLNILFKNDVELILLFKDAEEGDMILIDNTIEAAIKNQP